MLRNGWRRVPVIEPIDPRYCWEHMPLDYYRYGEYPRFFSAPGAHRDPPWKWERIPSTSQKPSGE